MVHTDWLGSIDRPFPTALLSPGPFPKRLSQSYLRLVSCLHKGFPCQRCCCSLSWQQLILANCVISQNHNSTRMCQCWLNFQERLQERCQRGLHAPRDRSAAWLFWEDNFPILGCSWRTLVWILSQKVWFSGGLKDDGLLYDLRRCIGR